MSSTFLMNTTKRQLMLVNHVIHPIKTPFLCNKLHSKPYFRFPHFLRKPRQYEISSSFSSSSSSSTSLSKVGLVGWYLGMVKSRPILTKSVTSSLIYTAADISSQTIVRESSEPFDFIRTLRMAGYGMVILGPSLHFWFNFVSKLFPKRDLFSTLKKMVMGQTIYGPSMTVIFFSSNARLQGETGSEIVARLKRDLLPTWLNGIMYWPICDFITFKFIPVHLQPLVSNSFSYLWTVYMTYMASLEKAT
ncbi:PXMP2/4 family protein 4, partial [Mucuna pruriens]